MSLNVIPKKSASLILVRGHNSNSIYNYQVLLLKRNKNTSFSNMYAFPGGLYDKEKDQVLSNSMIDNLQKTAYRETLEETGLWFFSEKMKQSKNELEEIKKEFKSKGLDWYSFNILNHRLGNNLKIIQPFIRLITIPYLNPRYDTQFFFHRIQNNQVFNWKNYYIGESFQSSSEKWDCINYDTQEFNNMIWMNPLETIQKHYEEGLGLAPPQFIILNIMSHFTDILAFEAFLKSSFQKERNPFIYPNMLCLRNTEDVDKEREKAFKYVALGNCDDKYPIELVASKEKEEILKKELLESHKGMKGKVRIFFKDMKGMFQKDYDVDIALSESDPFNYLKSYKDINILYTKFR